MASCPASLLLSSGLRGEFSPLIALLIFFLIWGSQMMMSLRFLSRMSLILEVSLRCPHYSSTRLRQLFISSFWWALFSICMLCKMRWMGTTMRKMRVARKKKPLRASEAMKKGFEAWFLRPSKRLGLQQSMVVVIMVRQGMSISMPSLNSYQVKLGCPTLFCLKLVKIVMQETSSSRMLASLFSIWVSEQNRNSEHMTRIHTGISSLRMKASLQDVSSKVNEMCLKELNSSVSRWSKWLSCCCSNRPSRKLVMIFLAMAVCCVLSQQSACSLRSCHILSSLLKEGRYTSSESSICLRDHSLLRAGSLSSETASLEWQVTWKAPKSYLLKQGENWWTRSFSEVSIIELYLTFQVSPSIWKVCDRTQRLLRTSMRRQGKYIRSNSAGHSMLPRTEQVTKSSVKLGSMCSFTMKGEFSALYISGIMTIWLKGNSRVRCFLRQSLTFCSHSLPLVSKRRQMVMQVTKRAVTVLRSQSMPTIQSTQPRGQTGTKMVFLQMLQVKGEFQMWQAAS